MRSADEYFEVVKLIAAGLNDCEIERRTSIPRKTVWEWRRMPGVRPRSTTDSSGRCTVHDFAALPAKAYCYVLGMYLGDGCISRGARTWHLRITLDTKYPGIIDGCCEAIEILMPGQRATIVSRKDNCVDVVLCSNHWPCLFPQHGPGRKHHRRIALEPWQEAIVKEAPEDFVRSLIHSDGCRVVADDRGVKSIRYHFTNHSEDILGLFTSALDLLVIPWTRSTKYVVSIYRKAATARLDEFIGPKV